ncbi:MAG: hypothetical protein MHMPM18_000257 [Marteilia pararefringens]
MAIPNRTRRRIITRTAEYRKIQGDVRIKWFYIINMFLLIVQFVLSCLYLDSAILRQMFYPCKETIMTIAYVIFLIFCVIIAIYCSINYKKELLIKIFLEKWKILTIIIGISCASLLLVFSLVVSYMNAQLDPFIPGEASGIKMLGLSIASFLLEALYFWFFSLSKAICTKLPEEHPILSRTEAGDEINLDTFV